MLLGANRPDLAAVGNDTDLHRNCLFSHTHRFPSATAELLSRRRNTVRCVLHVHCKVEIFELELQSVLLVLYLC